MMQSGLFISLATSVGDFWGRKDTQCSRPWNDFKPLRITSGNRLFSKEFKKSCNKCWYSNPAGSYISQTSKVVTLVEFLNARCQPTTKGFHLWNDFSTSSNIKSYIREYQSLPHTISCPQCHVSFAKLRKTLFLAFKIQLNGVSTYYSTVHSLVTVQGATKHKIFMTYTATSKETLVSLCFSTLPSLCST